jgi:hypothetical protein
MTNAFSLKTGFLLLCVSVTAFAQQNGGYLFARMHPQNYGRLYYSISRNGTDWITLNDGKNVLPDYLGHPDLIKGGDGKWHMIGVVFGQGIKQPYPVHWQSDNLVTWTPTNLPHQVMAVDHLDHRNDGGWFGAPKLAYDPETKQYAITWHAAKKNMVGNQQNWESMRTMVILTADFVNFTKAKHLFNFTEPEQSMATIDTILKKIDGTWYAIIKDERWPNTVPTGKTIRIAKSKAGILGPYENPGAPVTPAWREAPTCVLSPDNKPRIYAEQYPHKYELYQADAMNGPWKKVDFTPPEARHGCIVQINEGEFNALMKAYGPKN